MTPSESDIQIQIVDYLSHLAAVRKDFIFFSVPNEGFLKGVALIAGRESKSALTHATLGRLKKQGMTDGIPDLCIVRKGGGVFFLEVKKAGANCQRIRSASIHGCGILGYLSLSSVVLTR